MLIACWLFIIGWYLVHLNRVLPENARVLHKADGSVSSRLILEFSSVFSSRWARTVLLTVFIEGGLVFVALTFLPAHLHTIYNLSLASAGAMVTLFGFGGLIFAVVSRVLDRRLG